MRGILDYRLRAPRVLFAVVHLITSVALWALLIISVILTMGPHPVASQPTPAEPLFLLGLVVLLFVAVRIVFEARRLYDLGVHPAWCLAAKLPFVALLVIAWTPSLADAADGVVIQLAGWLVLGLELVGFLALALIPGDREPNAAGTPPPSPWKLSAGPRPSPV